MVPEGTVKIDFGCFRNTDTETITLPSSLKEIGWEAFRWCKNLKEIALPEELEIIGIGCFRDTAIKEITIPKSVRRMEKSAFSGYIDENKYNRSLEKVTLQDGLESIGELCFCDTGLKEISIPSTVTSIGS